MLPDISLIPLGSLEDMKKTMSNGTGKSAHITSAPFKRRGIEELTNLM